MTAPQGCKTPARDREEYNLTMADLRFMTAQADKIIGMLMYYANMPENKTGELAISFKGRKGYDAFSELCGKINDIQMMLDDVTWG